MPQDTAPLIVSALFGPDDFAWLDGLRRAHFPPERNQLAAHLTLFHHLPPSLEPELAHRLAGLTRTAPPPARATAIMNLGRGTAIAVAAPMLAKLRSDLAEAFRGMLTPQDQAGWRPHVTIQNKVGTSEARTLQVALGAGFAGRDIRIEGIGVWRYRGGPWERAGRYPFRGA